MVYVQSLMNTNTFSQKLDGTGIRVAIIRARFNERITAGLLRGCRAGLRVARVASRDVRVIEVPGSFEIPVVAEQCTRIGDVDVVIALGCVIKGETKHDEYIASAVAHGITNVAIKNEVPVIFGVITPNSMEQALARAGKGLSNKGYEAALAAVETVLALRRERDASCDAATKRMQAYSS